MKKIIYTQRVEFVERYGERRDCCDQMIPKFLKACGLLPIPIMNCPDLADELLNTRFVDGIFFTGGNDLAAYGGNAPERDEMEKKLLEYALNNDIPLFGICRGMQFLLHYFGTKLRKVENHIRREHSIHGGWNRSAVNSFHGMGATIVKPPLKVLAYADDGIVEAVQHCERKIAGVMWHPERVVGFSSDDIIMIKRFYEGGGFI